MPRWTKTLVERFNDKYIKTPDDNDCWLWLACKDSCGYGIIWDGTRNVKASRLSYTIINGPIPEGMSVCHKCDVPSCVNPSHLFLGSQKDNNLDCVAKNRNKPPKGELNGRSKLTYEDVLTIRELGKTHTKEYISTLYPVSRQQISDIIRLKKWK